MKSLKSNLTINEITTILFNTAIDLGMQGLDWDYGHGLLNASGAIIETNLLHKSE